MGHGMRVDVQEALESQACKGERIGEDRYSINFCLAGASVRHGSRKRKARPTDPSSNRLGGYAWLGGPSSTIYYGS